MKRVLLSVVSVIIVIVIIGIYKFNFINDDIYQSHPNIESKDLIGSWVQPIPGNEKETQGFTLNEDGTAQSINMFTLLYKSWKLTDSTLVLTAESIGNHTSSIFDDVYKIELLANGKLILIRGELMLIYTKSIPEQPNHKTEHIVAKYISEKGKVAYAEYVNTEKITDMYVILQLDNTRAEKIKLKIVRSGSGVRYTDNKYLWWIKGRAATLYRVTSGKDDDVDGEIIAHYNEITQKH
jgi:membrane-bound inhibitor of C-type lysozyme